VPAMTFANLGNFKLQKWGFLLCNSVHFYFTTNIFSFLYGDDILKKLGVEPVPANDIILNPTLLRK